MKKIWGSYFWVCFFYDYYEEIGTKAANIGSYENALNFTIKKYLNKN
jgi:hypothetical protein